ncbi:MAG: alpha/beta fold hydrolase [Lysobacterales bacterium]
MTRWIWVALITAAACLPAIAEESAEVTRAYGVHAHGQMHYRIARPDTATQNPLMCLHMSPSSGRIYHRLLRDMGRDRIAIAPDTPGFGESDPPAKPPEIADYARANFALLDQLGIQGPVDVMGYHTGSLTAMEMARQQPERIRRLVLVSAAMFTPEEFAQMKVEFAPRPLHEDGKHLVDLWLELRHWRDPQQSLEETQWNFAEHLRGGQTAWWGHRAAFNYPRGDVLPTLMQPILVLNPEDDLYDYTLRAAAKLQNGRVHNLPGWSHGFLDIHTAEVAALLRGFLDSE